MMKGEIMPATFNSFYAGLKFVELDPMTNELVVSTDAPTLINVMDRYSPLLRSCVREVYGKPYGVVFKSEGELKDRDFRRLGTGEEFNFNSAYNFDNFVVGSNNELAYAAAHAVANSPAKAYNPLYIYGGSGLGKTHLMHAIGMHIMENFPEMKILYVSSEKFTNEFITATQNRTMSEFKERYRNVDVLLIDDIQFLEGKKETQEEFFYTFNTLYDLNKQIVISCDIEPNKLKNLDDRLRSRFQWNLVADIAAPEYETRVAILRKKAELSGLEPDEEVNEVINLIAEKVKFNIRELEGAFTRIISFSNLMNRKIDLRFAKMVLKDILKDNANVVTADSIKKAVSKQYGVSPADLESSKKSMNVTLPRQIAIYLCKELTDLSLSSIGEAFGGRDHSTVLHSYAKIQKEMAQNEDLNNIVNRLAESISGK